MTQRLASSENTDLYDFEGQIISLHQTMKNEFSEENYTIINRYDEAMINEALAKATRLKHLQTITNLTRILKKEWAGVTKSDIDTLTTNIMKRYATSNGQESNTSFDHKKILKIFFRWFKLGSRQKTEVGDPIETKSIKLKRVRDELARESLVTDSDLTRLLHACNENQRDRAFIDVHYEAGTRPGEILSLSIKHVKFDKYGAFITVNGKTGPRPIRLIRSVPNLAKWMESHPFKNNPESPLFIMFNKSNFGKSMTYHGARQILRRRCEQAGLDKKINLKLFRHSEATTSANFMTEAQMRKRHGWTTDSKMPSRYVHLVNADVDQAILSHNGIVKQDEKNLNLPKTCPICNMPNSSQSERCTQCGKPLDLNTAIVMDEKQNALNLNIEDQKVRITRLENSMTEIKMILTAGRIPSKLVRLTPEIQFIV